MLNIEDIPENQKLTVSNIYSKVYPDYWGYKKAFKNIDKLCLTFEGSNIVAAVSLQGDRIMRFGVDPNYLGRGIATKMLTKLKIKVPNLWVTAGIDYPAVHKVFEKSGFNTCNEYLKIIEYFPEGIIHCDSMTNRLSFTQQVGLTAHISDYKQYIFN